MKKHQKIIQERREVQGTWWRYKVSNLWRAEWPQGLLNEKMRADWSKAIKEIFWYPQITISFQDKDGHITERKDKLVHVLIAETFPEWIEWYDIKDKFDNPRLTHKDNNRKNNNNDNLQRIDFKPSKNRKEGNGKWYITYNKEQENVIDLLIQDPNQSNKAIAKKVFGEKYEDTWRKNNRHDQFVYRERIKLEQAKKIPLSPQKQQTTIIADNKNRIIELLKKWKYTQKKIAQLTWVSETYVSRIKKKVIPEEK